MNKITHDGKVYIVAGLNSQDIALLALDAASGTIQWARTWDRITEQ